MHAYNFEGTLTILASALYTSNLNPAFFRATIIQNTQLSSASLATYVSRGIGTLTAHTCKKKLLKLNIWTLKL